MNETLRQIPGIDALLQKPQVQVMVETFGRTSVLESMRSVLDGLRSDVMDGGKIPTQEMLVVKIGEVLEARFKTSLRPVINATGVILHTNLGRAPLSESAIRAVRNVAEGYSNLEFSLSDGQRGKRDAHIENLVADVIGAESAMVVNNCASALLLVLSALASGREVVISRGQLVEIGGGFRIPDVMQQTGATLVEVGTTNRTRLEDFERALSEETAIIMRAHASNFRIIGFTQQPPLAELGKVALSRDLRLLDDLGSGALLDTGKFGLEHEPMVQESLAAGADVVTFSGDKLLGGPQAGIIVGREEALDQLKRHPLARALRVDKMTIAALVATLDHYRRDEALEHIPIWRMISKPLDSIEAVAETWARAGNGKVIGGKSTVGGGSLPGETLPTALCALSVEAPAQFQAALRDNIPPIIARVKNDQVLLDARTVDEADVYTVTAALERLL